jgi:DNA-binding protein H-NS
VNCDVGVTNRLVSKMQSRDLKSMSLDQLWNLHEELVVELTRKMAAEKARLDERLHKLDPAGDTLMHERRPYPKVLPKYRNPKNPAETWAGRGRQPRWLRAQLRSGKKLDDFRIERLADNSSNALPRDRPDILATSTGRAKSALTNGVDRRFRK